MEIIVTKVGSFDKGMFCSWVFEFQGHPFNITEYRERELEQRILAHWVDGIIPKIIKQ